MLNKTQQEIIALFLKSPFESYTVFGISKILNRYVSQVQDAITYLEKNKIVSVKKLGTKTSSCTLNFSTADTDVLSCASLYAKKSFIDSNLKIKVIVNEIEKKLAEELYIMLVFGSYAKGTQTKKSDIDLCFIVQEEKNVAKFKSKIAAILDNFSYKVHVVVFALEWFYNMLSEKDSIGREILKWSVVLHGHDVYYNLVKKYDKESGYSESDIAL